MFLHVFTFGLCGDALSHFRNMQKHIGVPLPRGPNSNHPKKTQIATLPCPEGQTQTQNITPLDSETQTATHLKLRLNTKHNNANSLSFQQPCAERCQPQTNTKPDQACDARCVRKSATNKNKRHPRLMRAAKGRPPQTKKRT